MDLPAAIKDISRDLAARDDHTPSSLGSALRKAIRIEDVADFVRFDPKNYVRNIVTSGPGWEIRLLCWRPHQTSTLHGHGASACAFRVLRGSAVELILGARDRVWAPGDIIEESGPNLVHQVGNAGTDALLTLHAYSPALPVDAPSPREGRNVVIVGGGLSGVAVAMHLLRRADSNLRVMLVESGPWLGRGVAYGIDNHVFRLNVPAGKMSIDPDRPDDFVRWTGAGTDPDAFLPRAVYGAYVVERFGETIRKSSGKLRVVRGEAAAVEPDAVVLTDGRRLPAEVVVLATGLLPRRSPGALPVDARIVDAWDECGLATLPRDGKLLLVGAGLTAIDVITFLHAHRFSGHATLLSRRGLLPRPHVSPLGPAAAVSPSRTKDLPSDLRSLLAWGRQVVRDFEARGEPWQHAIDALRPHTSQLWRGLPPADRARFVRSVRPYWEVLRHRAPADVMELIRAWRSSGRMDVVAGSVAGCQPRQGGLLVEIRRAGGNTVEESYDAIVRCVGPAIERSEADSPLIGDLIHRGRAVADPAGLGIISDDRGRVVTPNGEADPNLLVIGALRRASSWETTAAPDISVHALAIAKSIIP